MTYYVYSALSVHIHAYLALYEIQTFYPKFAYVKHAIKDDSIRTEHGADGRILKNLKI